jgi:hypothetical protein
MGGTITKLRSSKGHRQCECRENLEAALDARTSLRPAAVSLRTSNRAFTKAGLAVATSPPIRPQGCVLDQLGAQLAS